MYLTYSQELSLLNKHVPKRLRKGTFRCGREPNRTLDLALLRETVEVVDANAIYTYSAKVCYNSASLMSS